MIESGLFTWALANPALQPLLGQSDQEKSTKSYSAFYFSFLPKGAPTPAIVLDRLKTEEADDTLDKRSPFPGASILARFQFGCDAQDSPENPWNPDGYLSAAYVAFNLRRQIMTLPGSDLPDLTRIQDVQIEDEFDAHFQMGAESYIFRRMLVVSILYVEAA